jgi:DNA-binding winged helix-turn-helix (wHTH) protein
MEGQGRTTFRFDGWTVSRDSGDLARGEHSTRLQVQPLLILIELLENPGEVVTRERLIAKLWPKGIVEFDASLNTAVRKLRIALNDDPEKPRYIETIPRRGYRFVDRTRASSRAPVRGSTPKTLVLWRRHCARARGSGRCGHLLGAAAKRGRARARDPAFHRHRAGEP